MKIRDRSHLSEFRRHLTTTISVVVVNTCDIGLRYFSPAEINDLHTRNPSEVASSEVAPLREYHLDGGSKEATDVLYVANSGVVECGGFVPYHE